MTSFNFKPSSLGALDAAGGSSPLRPQSSAAGGEATAPAMSGLFGAAPLNPFVPTGDFGAPFTRRPAGAAENAAQAMRGRPRPRGAAAISAARMLKRRATGSAQLSPGLQRAPTIPSAKQRRAKLSPKSSSTFDVAAAQSRSESKSSGTAAAQLRALVGRKAKNAFDKYQILDERDKILKRARVKESNVERAAVTRGCCPDMCPERERYQRQVQHRLSAFETTADGAVDHRRAVKEYQRSSADQARSRYLLRRLSRLFQEEPLAHELRSSAVLERTMNYLIGDIAERPPTGGAALGAWYDFLWSRTRAIRKDLTQQMLTDANAVALMEKCARLHVFAAHHLAECDLADFDPRMNIENLTKSLQSLRHMYDDAAKRGVCVSQCEPEFRSYDVILNLNDSDILRQVLSYRKTVRQSDDVRLAVRLVSAFSGNNYVQFFNLIAARATYLQACIAHRHFEPVRAAALQTIARAYRGGRGNTLMPVRDLERMLRFESTEQAVEFCMSEGVGAANVDGCWMLTYGSIDPEDRPELSKRRSLLVHAKLACPSLAQVLNGGTRPPTVSDAPPPVVSFDGADVYCGDPVVKAFLARDGDGVQLPQPSMDGFPRSLNRMTQVALKAFIRQLLGVITGKPRQQWVDESVKPVWWPSVVPWSGALRDIRTGDAKSELRWTDALKMVVRNCYEFYGQADKLEVDPVHLPDSGSVAEENVHSSEGSSDDEEQRAAEELSRQALDKAGHYLASSLVELVCSERVRAEAVRAVRIAETERAARLRAESRSNVEQWAKRSAESLVMETVAQSAEELARKELLLWRRDVVRQNVDRRAETLAAAVLSDECERRVAQVARRCFAELVVSVRDRLATVHSNLDRLWLRQFTDHWVGWTRRRRQRRRSLDALPLLPSGRLSAAASRRGQRGAYVSPERLESALAGAAAEADDRRRLAAVLTPRARSRFAAIRRDAERALLRRSFNAWLHTARDSRCRSRLAAAAYPSFHLFATPFTDSWSCGQSGGKRRRVSYPDSSDWFLVDNNVPIFGANGLTIGKESGDMDGVPRVVDDGCSGEKPIAVQVGEHVLLLERLRRQLDSERLHISSDEQRWKHILDDDSSDAPCS